MLMARYCEPRMAGLVARVPFEKPQDNNFQLALIRAVVHGSQMARLVTFFELREVIYQVTEKLFDSSTPGNFSICSDSHSAILRMTSHASNMALICQSSFEAILRTIDQFSHNKLPITQHELDTLHADLELARRGISNINHGVLMSRISAPALRTHAS
jgi:hypothetical protein